MESSGESRVTSGKKRYSKKGRFCREMQQQGWRLALGWLGGVEEKRALGSRTLRLGNGEDDFAELLAFFEVVVGGDAVVEGPDFIDDGF
jgi:hypothetical protein